MWKTEDEYIWYAMKTDIISCSWLFFSYRYQSINVTRSLVRQFSMKLYHGKYCLKVTKYIFSIIKLSSTLKKNIILKIWEGGVLLNVNNCVSENNAFLDNENWKLKCLYIKQLKKKIMKKSFKILKKNQTLTMRHIYHTLLSLMFSHSRRYIMHKH